MLGRSSSYQRHHNQQHQQIRFKIEILYTGPIKWLPFFCQFPDGIEYNCDDHQSERPVNNMVPVGILNRVIAETDIDIKNHFPGKNSRRDQKKKKEFFISKDVLFFEKRQKQVSKGKCCKKNQVPAAILPFVLK